MVTSLLGKRAKASLNGSTTAVEGVIVAAYACQWSSNHTDLLASSFSVVLQAGSGRLYDLDLVKVSVDIVD